MIHILRRKDAMLAGKLRYYTGNMCRNGHDCERYTSNGACIECIRPSRMYVKHAIAQFRVVRLTVRVPNSATDEHVTRLSHWIDESCIPAFFQAEHDAVATAAGLKP